MSDIAAGTYPKSERVRSERAAGNVVTLPVLPFYEHTVADWCGLRQERHHAGNVFVDELTMSDGMPYEIHIGQPADQQTDVPVVMTTAWFTGTGGHNKHAMLKFMETGYPVVLVGPEGQRGHHDQLGTWLGRASHVRLSYTAHNMLTMLDAISGPHQFDPERLVLAGESRGAMTAFCMHATADRHNRTVAATVAVAPCYALPFGTKDIPGFVEQLGHEPLDLLKSLGRVSLKSLPHYLHTYPYEAGLRFLAQASLLTPALFSGEAGHHARLIPKDDRISLFLFDGDYSSQAAAWRTIFEHHTNTSIEQLPGGHLSIPDALPRVQRILRELLPQL